MPKRFHATEIWNEDWFVDLTPSEKFLWFFILDDCDHAGIWKPNKRLFNALTGSRINLDDAVLKFNKDKQRVLILPNGRWVLIDFISFQYGHIMNTGNKLHLSILSILNQNEVNLTCLGGQVQVKHGLKDKDKDKDILEEVPVST